MDKTLKVGRMLIVGAIVLVIFAIFTLQLMKLQIVNGSEYAKEMMEGSEIEFYLPVARGEILDINGVPLVANRTGYNIQFLYAFLPRGKQNDEQNKIILELTELMTQRREEWEDELPITKTAPFKFLNDSEDEIAELKENLGKQHYATIEEIIDGLKETFEISEDYSDEEMRIIAGVRYNMLTSGFGVRIPYTFAEDVSKDTVIIVNERSKAWPGVITLEGTIRDVSGANVAPHIIGNIGRLYLEEYQEKKKEQELLIKADPDVDQARFYTMNDFIGKTGIEEKYEDVLRGTRGLAKIEFDSNNVAIGSTYDVVEPPMPGNSVKLTIDAELNKLANESLEKQIKNLNETAPEGEGKEAEAGAVITLDVETGSILSSTTYPSFDITKLSENYTRLKNDKLSPLYNRALLGTYAPGSTFKPMMSIAGLSEGIITDESTYLCERVFRYRGYSPGCLSYHGNYNVVNALKKSCNIFYYRLGLDLGIDKIDEYSKAFGLGEETGIEIYEEIGQRSNPQFTEEVLGEVWNPGDVIQTSIGQSRNSFTPLQIANYAATIGRNGVLLKTHLVDSIVSYNGDEVIEETEPVEISRLPNKNKAFAIVKEGMREASSWTGTAGQYFGDYPIPVASKTGTPQTSGLVNSVFICFAPVDKPKIAIVVIIEKGWHGYTGAPVARDIMNAYFFNDYDIYD